ncbi:degenerin deg-1-like [Convolutriloba macropyga]|uniref:degenerin deg-1-like n=1 Tax=Convolutriloba macropyga TaxID=536237 RepID=UPI003F520A24
MTLFVDSSEYIGALSSNTGLRVAITNFGEKPNVESQSVAASVGDATIINVKAQKTVRLGGKFGKCVNNYPISLGFNRSVMDEVPYSQSYCNELCLVKHVADECLCGEQNFRSSVFDDPRLESLPKCSISNNEETDCRERIYRAFKEKEFSCPCELPCTSVKHDIDASRSTWPSKAYSSYLATNLIKNRRHNGDLRSFLKDLSNCSQSHIHQRIRDNFARVEIFFQSSMNKKITEKPAYSFSDLLSDFGGNISLWLGWSIFALIEVLIFLLRCIEAFYTSVKPSSPRSATQVTSDQTDPPTESGSKSKRIVDNAKG